MKKIKRRSAAALVLVGLAVLGLAVYLVRLLLSGGDWVSQPFNTHVYSDGVLAVGTVLDRNGTVLSGVTGTGARYYNDDRDTRLATLHAVGDLAGNIGTGALTAQADALMGYDLLDGVYSLDGRGNDVTLTIDASLNRTAWSALAGRKGAVALYDYTSGEVLCMVSSPAFDPNDPWGFDPESESYAGVYLNRVLSSTYTPGSVFKLVTLAAAMDAFEDYDTRTYVCEGHYDVDGGTVTCTGTHGTVDIATALAESCNCAFAQMALELGGETLRAYAEKFGLLESGNVSGVPTAAGSFAVAEDGSLDLAWSGIGQYDDLVNPAAMLRFVGAIANGGVAVTPRTVQGAKTSWGLPAGVAGSDGDERLLTPERAGEIAAMMRSNVLVKYGEGTFPGLPVCGKTGTAEVGEGLSPHAWFVGFLDDADHPYAIVVVVENGGSGLAAAGSVANTVLQAAVGLA